MRASLETERTIMRPFHVGDAEEAFAWFSDPGVMRYIPSGADSTIDETRARVGRYIEHQNEYGFSKWVIADRWTHHPIGDCGFYHLPDARGVELGYRLAQRYWGRGLATEVAKRWVEVANDFLDASTIFAFAHPDNVASLRVMLKLGFRFSRHEILYGMQAQLFELPIRTTPANDGSCNTPNTRPVVL